MLDPHSYKGIALNDLEINVVAWAEARKEHIRSRTTRYEGTETDIEPEWATEAALDPQRVVRVAGNAEETSSLKVIGYSASVPPSGDVLKVWIWSDDPESGEWNGASACIANASDRKKYGKESL